MIKILLPIFTLIATLPLLGDQYHYSNIIIGERAIGLGGAYTGVAGDASGVFYNPAGMAFALSNDISGSANALYRRNVTHKETIGKNDFVEESSGMLPSFFGGLQKLDHLVKGLVFGFGIYSIDNELKDQNDNFEERVNLGTPSACPNSTSTDPRPPFQLLRFHRSVTQRASTSVFSGALGWRAFDNMAFGVGLDYVNVDELIQEYQDVKTEESQCKNDGDF